MAYEVLNDSNNYILGSGELYLGTIENIETATEEQIATALENVGSIEKGASLSYKVSTKDIETANRGIIDKIITKEEVIFKTGVLSWKLDNLQRLAPATVTKDATKNTKTLTIGGKGSIPVNYLRFVHTKKDGKKLIVNIFKAMSEGGFEFEFDSEKPLSVNYEFTSLAKRDGTLVEIIEEFIKVA